MRFTETIDLSKKLKPLGDPLRLGLMILLADGREHCVCEMAEAMHVPEFKISRKLTPLKKLGLVCARRSGTWMYYRLCKDTCEELFSQCSQALELKSTQKTKNKNSRTMENVCTLKTGSSCCVPATPPAVK